MGKINIFILFFILFLFPRSMDSGVNKFKLDPDNTYIDNVEYDKELNLIVINVHAKVLWISINEYYGIKVQDTSNVTEDICRLLGSKIEIVHLSKEVK